MVAKLSVPFGLPTQRINDDPTAIVSLSDTNDTYRAPTLTSTILSTTLRVVVVVGLVLLLLSVLLLVCVSGCNLDLAHTLGHWLVG
jgi:hypothetical protein